MASEEAKLVKFKMPTIIRLDEKELPVMKGWKVGDTYELDVKVKMLKYGADEYDEKAPKEGTFKILSVESDDDTEDKEPTPRAKKLDALKEKSKEY